MSTEAFESVKIARDSKRPTGLDYINAMFSEFFELHGDRRFGDDAAIVGGVAYLGRQPVTVIAIEKGHTIKERNARLSGAPHPEGYRKGSPITYAEGLEGNLLLIHGTGDDNVHYQNCEMLVNKLIKNGKMFTQISYPMRSHSINEREGTTLHLEHLPAGGK